MIIDGRSADLRDLVDCVRRGAKTRSRHVPVVNRKWSARATSLSNGPSRAWSARATKPLKDRWLSRAASARTPSLGAGCLVCAPLAAAAPQPTFAPYDEALTAGGEQGAERPYAEALVRVVSSCAAWSGCSTTDLGLAGQPTSSLRRRLAPPPPLAQMSCCCFAVNDTIAPCESEQARSGARSDVVDSSNSVGAGAAGPG